MTVFEIDGAFPIQYDKHAGRRNGQTDEEGVVTLIKFILRRILLMIPVLFGVIFIVFTINRMTPGDPTLTILGADATEEQYEQLREELGLNDPFFVQFFDYMKGLLTEFDLGTSYTTRRSVSDEILERFPTTLRLGLIGVFITVLIGIPFGVISATRQYTLMDYGVTLISMFFAAMPNFWLALMMMLLFSLKLKWFPASGLDSWKGWVMPCLALGLSPVATVTRLTRSSMLEVIRQDYIRTARAKGVSEFQVVSHHALRNALIPVITTVGIQLGHIMAGSVVIESIFGVQGIGMLMVNAINNKNYPVVQGCVLLLSMSVCVINLVIDLLYSFIDPRIKAQIVAGKPKGGTPSKAKRTEEQQEVA